MSYNSESLCKLNNKHRDRQYVSKKIYFYFHFFSTKVARADNETSAVNEPKMADQPADVISDDEQPEGDEDETENEDESKDEETEEDEGK